MDTSFERTKSEESWISPPELVKSLGHFDLDPCQCIPQPFTFADECYTIEDDGLSKNWGGANEYIAIHPMEQKQKTLSRN